jgi:hypothetical protein
VPRHFTLFRAAGTARIRSFRLETVRLGTAMSDRMIPARFLGLVCAVGAGFASSGGATTLSGASSTKLAPESSPISMLGLDAAERSELLAGFQPTLRVVPEETDSAIPDHPALSDRFFFGLGFFAASSNTEARLDSPSGIGATVDFEDGLGLDSNDIVPQFLGRWRMSDRWRLELEHFSIDRSNTRTLDTDIVWGDETFPAGTDVTASFDIAVTRLSFGYSFFKRQDKELGVALGFHVTDIGAQLVSTGGNGDDGKLLAPLPVISLYGQCALTDVWAIAGRLDAFRLEYDAYEGHVYSIGVDALCQPWRHFGFGLGWRALEIEASAENDGWKGEVATNYQGPIVFVAVSF